MNGNHFNTATAKIAGCLQQSTVVMASMNEMIKLPQLHRTMMDMAKEMEKVLFAKLDILSELFIYHI